MRFFNLEKKTEPILLHFNAASKKELLNNDFLNRIIISKKIIKPNNLTILTFLDKKISKEKSPLIKQLELNKINYINICDFYDNENWNNKLKISLLKDFLNKNKLTKYIAVLDSLDVVLSENFNRIFNDFKKSNYKIIYGAGKNMYPNINIGDEIYTKVNSSTRYLNAGTVIGEKKYLFDFINFCENFIEDKINIWNSEQYIIRRGLSEYKYKEIIHHDYECNTFQTMDRFSFIERNNYILIK